MAFYIGAPISSLCIDRQTLQKNSSEMIAVSRAGFERLDRCTCDVESFDVRKNIENEDISYIRYGLQAKAILSLSIR